MPNRRKVSSIESEHDQEDTSSDTPYGLDDEFNAGKHSKRLMVMLSKDESNINEEFERKIDDILKTDLPLSRVKKIAKLDPEVSMMNNEAARLVAKSTELFLIELAKACYAHASGERRKTVQKKDLDRVIKSDWMFEFLEDALDGWPEPGHTKLFGESGETIHETEELDETAVAENAGAMNEDDVVNMETVNEEDVDVDDMETMLFANNIRKKQAETPPEEEHVSEDCVQETPDIFD